MIYGIIPARLDSTRLPRKMLLAETGKPLIQHTYEAVRRCPMIARAMVATNSIEIFNLTECDVIQTGEHSTGTERVAEAARRLGNASIVVNIQGDEPEIDPEALATIVRRLEESQTAKIVTLSAPLAAGELENPNVVKVRMQPNRVPEFTRNPDPRFAWRHHVGVYGFRAETLQQAAAMPQHPDEIEQRLEQLRWVRAGVPIVVEHVASAHPGIDTPEDYRRFVERQRNG